MCRFDSCSGHSGERERGKRKSTWISTVTLSPLCFSFSFRFRFFPTFSCVLPFLVLRLAWNESHCNTRFFSNSLLFRRWSTSSIILLSQDVYRCALWVKISFASPNMLIGVQEFHLSLLEFRHHTWLNRSSSGFRYKIFIIHWAAKVKKVIRHFQTINLTWRLHTTVWD